MKRAFIAIPLSLDVSSQVMQFIEKLQIASLAYSNSQIRWVDSQKLHITVKFLGNIADRNILQIQQIIQFICKSFPPFAIRLSSIGTFSKRDSAVLWLSVHNPDNQLISLKNKIDYALNSFNFKEENKLFRPHLTLARSRGPFKFNKFLNSEMTLTSEYVIVKNLILFESQISSSGAIYIPIASLPLEDSTNKT